MCEAALLKLGMKIIDLGTLKKINNENKIAVHQIRESLIILSCFLSPSNAKYYMEVIVFFQPVSHSCHL